MLKVYISKTKNIGKGLFAKADIKKNEVICIAKGVLIKDSYTPNYRSGPNWIAIGRKLWLSPFEKNPVRYVNHSCNPNAGIKGKVTIVAMKNISKHHEITIDYSTTEEDPYWQMRCKCSSRNCRKLIKSIQFLPLKLFKKYQKYTPTYLKKSYLEMNKRSKS